MDLTRQEYPALLTSLQPNQATTVLNDRIRVINKVNTDIADWLQERRRVEELYVQGLRKLARRPQPEENVSLGVFQMPWKRIINATESLAASHETLASKIEEDVEKPLRDYGSRHRELASMPSICNDLVHLSKGLEAAQKKLEKAKEKRSKGSEKATAASTSLAEATQQWESRAPFVFEQLQSVDESRLNHLRDVLTQLQTHEVDQIERSRQTAESCLNALLNVQTADEIKTFAAKINGGRESAPLRRSSSVNAAPTPLAPVSSPPVSTEIADLPPPPRIPDDAASQHSNRSGRFAREPPPVPEPRHTPKLGGLRRLGTVMNRRKSVVLGSGSSISGQEKKIRPAFTFRRGDSSREAQQLPSTPPGRDTPSITGDFTASPTTSVSLREPPVREESSTIAPIQEVTETTVTTNGTTKHEATGQSQSAVAQPQIDSEGYSERPQIIDEITRAQREAAGLEESGLNLKIRDEPIHEDEGRAKQAMDDMANTLRMQGLQSGVRRNAGTIRGRRDVRNTVFIAPSAGSEQGPSSGLGAAPAAFPNTLTSPNTLAVSPTPAAPAAPVPSQEDKAMSDTTSIHSSHTLHSIAGPVSHPELHEPGLNASVVETVNSWFEGGNITKSFVVGELALAYNAAAGSTTQTNTVRLDNFALLEKVAANPYFVAEVSNTDDEKRGEYNVSLAKIARPIPTVAFKYQIHLTPSNLSSYSPVIFTPAWNIEEFQASTIIPYKLNPAFVASTPLESIILKNVIITVNLDLSPEDEITKQPREVARATNVAMYPNTGAVFRRKQSAVVWKLPELEVRADSDSKLLVRFTTAVSWPRKGKVETKFEYDTAETSPRLGVSVAETAGQNEKDPFADEGTAINPSTQASIAWKEIHTLRKLTAGKYVST
ncbi:Muniscin C-terminal mu homology domain-containing protein [Talaromyces proteolyticus]|uniref:Muniscin C-terminal mu homology domain-containing protein n=1 Tax=Talaromyces proteolyticus TaxID=1131652 RepID=A0AAD4PZ23_9EURO|nr:Muniscin C-terminal mu homology domain-containing protein [Talaromyces proteolyticus]KAH8698561.1 Muniscin C-terminal mu homology domain-containing protein [Talaromyces proteolyticus]